MTTIRLIFRLLACAIFRCRWGVWTAIHEADAALVFHRWCYRCGRVESRELTVLGGGLENPSRKSEDDIRKPMN